MCVLSRPNRHWPNPLLGVGVLAALAVVATACGSSANQAGTAVTVASASDAAGADAGGSEAESDESDGLSEPAGADDGAGQRASAPPSPPTVSGSGEQDSDEQGSGDTAGDPGSASDAPSAGETTQSPDAAAGVAVDGQADEASAAAGTVRPAWLGNRPLPQNADGSVPPQQTPPELIDRSFPTIDILPPPPDDRFRATVEPVSDEILARSTWNDGCPVTVDELRYLRMGFWGFDGRAHTGEMIVHRDVSEDVIEVFRTLFEARFPIEEMRVTAQPELDAEPTGDGNNTTGFVCRAAVGSTRFSEHAYGLAVDINPFHNPYQKGDLVLPELSTVYLDRDDVRPGMIIEGGVVVNAFDRIGWGWGGRWRSLDDYHHFSLNNR